MIVVPFHANHLSELRLQARQPKLELFSDFEYAQHLATGEAFTVFDDEMTVQACLGVIEHEWPGRAVCWALFSGAVKRLMLPIVFQARTFLDGCRYRRIEAYVDPTFEEALRLVAALGFQREGLMVKFTPAGDDQLLFARTK